MSKASEELRLEADVARWRTEHPGYETDGAKLGLRDTGGVLQFWKRTPSRIIAIDRVEFTARGGSRGKARGPAPVTRAKRGAGQESPEPAPRVSRAAGDASLAAE